jgi:spore maturation protein CgeB
MRIVISKPWGFAAPKIMRGFVEAFRALGHDVLIVETQDLFLARRARAEVERIAAFKPELALGYGFSALLRTGNTHLFAAMRVPTMHYFADDPFHPATIDDLAMVARDEYSWVWVWDRSYVADLQEWGVEKVGHLPLAANTSVFRKLDPDTYERLEYQCNISFAGNGDIEGRLPYLASVVDLGLVVFGDESRWRRHAGNTSVFGTYRGFLKTEEELNALYNTAEVNLNVTVGQGRASANFRVFNITAAGGFLLTDYRPGLEELFEIGGEIECYRTPEELREKAEHYLANPDEARAIAEAGYRRTVRDNSFVQRAESILRHYSDRWRIRESMVSV